MPVKAVVIALDIAIAIAIAIAMALAHPLAPVLAFRLGVVANRPSGVGAWCSVRV